MKKVKLDLFHFHPKRLYPETFSKTQVDLVAGLLDVFY